MADSLLGWRRRALVVAALLLVALATYTGRRGLIRSFFPDGAAQAAPEFTPLTETVELPSPVPRLRVVLLDGLSASVALTLPHLTERCRHGLDLFVDNGFPTVSLPVQHALWTGLTQQQSGVQYRIAKLQSPPARALPGLIDGSVAVAQSHPEIVQSFGFSRVELPTAEELEQRDAAARASFMDRARAAVTSDARLALVHVLEVDEAGHAHGADSEQYLQAAAAADRAVQALYEADGSAHGQSSTWLVLSDHGHRGEGGHGGAEPEIRHVRACLWGAGVEPKGLPKGRSIHLVDLSRALFDFLGVAPGAGAKGRPLAAALAAADTDATVPRASLGRVAVFWILLALGAAVTHRFAGGPVGWPWWAVLSYLGVLIEFGSPSLSLPAIYPPLGRDMLAAAAVGLSGATLQAWLRRRADPVRAAAALLVLPLCCGLGLLVMCFGDPPLLPRVTAELSVWLTLGWAGAAALALGVGLGGLGRPPRP